MRLQHGLPLFHLYGDPPDDQAFDFVHVETISSRSSVHNWVIGPHRHRNLFQILVVERGGGQFELEADRLPFTAPAIIMVGPTVVHGFHFDRNVTEGYVVTFTEDVALVLGEGDAPLHGLAAEPPLQLASSADISKLSELCRALLDERMLARPGMEVAARAYLSLIVVELLRVAASHAQSGAVTLAPTDSVVADLRRLIERHFRSERQLEFYADKLGMTADRLSDHVKRATGVTAGHLVRQRVLIEAKRQLVFTNASIGEIAYELAFVDPSHFGRFFKKQTGMTPQEFRSGRTS